MTATLMDGTAVATQLLRRLESGVARVREHTGRPPTLATVLIGDDPASHTYVRMKVSRSRKVGIDSVRVDLPAATTTAEAVAAVRRLSEDPSVDGILVQHPAPAHVDERAVFEAVGTVKDVDGVTAASFASTALGGPGYPSCTPAGILALLDAYRVDLSGTRAVVVGRSPILGKPMSMLLLGRDATVTMCHSRTRDVAEQVREADVVVAAVGHPHLIRAEWVASGAVVVDAGSNPGNLGDVEPSVVDRASLLTPVPGGVGPMTIAMLLAHTLDAAERRAGLVAA